MMRNQMTLIAGLAIFLLVVGCSSNKPGNNTNSTDSEAIETNDVAVVQDTDSNVAIQSNADVKTDEENTEILTDNNASVEVIDHVVKLDVNSFSEKVYNIEKSHPDWKYEGELPAIVDFYATWCGPCKKAAPILEKIAKKYAGKVVIYKIDAEKQREVSAYFRVQSYPTFMIIPTDGQPMIHSGIGRTDEQTMKMFEDIIANNLLK